MREFAAEKVYEQVTLLCKEANDNLREDVLTALIDAADKEQDPIAADILKIIVENAELAAASNQPLCQDTGIGIFFVEIGQDLQITGGSIHDSICNAMRDVYTGNPYRLSVVKDPYFERINTGNNLPPIIHWEVVSGDKLQITFMPKGGGAENMSRIKMFTPLTNIEEIKDYIIDTVSVAGGKPCPPVIVGVGIGGSFDYATFLAKKALLRPLSSSNDNEKWAKVEKELFTSINNLNIGPMGLGGSTTSLGVNIETYPCHIASLPVAVNLQCHSHRYSSTLI